MATQGEQGTGCVGSLRGSGAAGLGDLGGLGVQNIPEKSKTVVRGLQSAAKGCRR